MACRADLKHRRARPTDEHTELYPPVRHSFFPTLTKDLVHDEHRIPLVSIQYNLDPPFPFDLNRNNNAPPEKGRCKRHCSESMETEKGR